MTEEFTYEIPWRRDLLGAGLQFAPEPPGVAHPLELDEGAGPAIDRASRHVIAALQDTRTWHDFETSSSLLRGEDFSQLATSRARAAGLLSPSAVGAYEPSNVMRRESYRREALERVVGELEGEALRYARAFESLTQLIRTACADVFGALLVNREPRTLSSSGFRALGDEHGRVGFETNVEDAIFLNTGEVVWLSGAPISSAVLVDRVNLNFQAATGTRIDIEGLPLRGSGTVWH